MNAIITATLFVVANWSFNPVMWKADDAGLTATVPTNSFAIHKSDSLYKRVTVSAEVTVLEELGETWKLAGVAIHKNDQNFWHFALVTSPKGDPEPFFELSEMQDGKWLSQTNLKQVVNTQAGGPWKQGQTYRLTISLGPEGIEGIATDADKQVVRHIKYEFTAPAVTTGVPALHCAGFKASFHQIETKMEQPVPQAKESYPPYESKSFLSDIQGEKTGFFRVEKKDGHWTAIDPLGRGFLPLGVDHVTYHGHWCEALGYCPHERKNQKKYSDRKVWEAETLSRLEKWGFNMIAAGGSHHLYRRGMTHAINLGIGEQFARLGEEYDICEAQGIPCSAFPNVFHPDFAAYCEHMASACKKYKNDPWLFGYFLDNELRWWGETGFNMGEGLFDTCMTKKPSHTAKKALVAFAKDRYDGDIQKLNQAWKTDFKAFDDILACENIESKTEQVIADKEAFVEKIADTYFKVLCEAIRTHDPNHMILGCRFAGGYASKEAWKKAGEYCDVLTFNYYGNVNLEHGVAMDHDSPWTGKTLREAFDVFYEMGQSPMIVTEWSFPALDAGLPSVHGAGQRFRTQPERTKATRIFAETMLRMPYMIGYDYFMWVDEPALGISKKFPEDSNYGLVNEDNEPYKLITEMFTELHQNASQLKREGFSKIGPPVKTPLKPKQFQGGLQPSPVQFSQEGDRYQVDAGKWKLEGKLGAGPFWSKVTFQDGKEVPLGRFNGMVQHKTTTYHWDEVNQVTKVTPVGDPNAPTAIDLVGRCNLSKALYEMAYRFTFFPEQDAFVVEMLWCKNLSDKPLKVKGIYFRPHSDIGGDAKNDLPINEAGEGAPRLWGAPLGDAWLDSSLGFYWGVAARPDASAKFYFWLNDQGGQHPDARWVLDEEIKPGEIYRPSTPIKVLSAAGQGKQLDWQKKAETALKKIAL